MQRNRIISIDIGSDTIKAVVGTKSAEGFEILNYASVSVQGVVCGVVTDVEKCTQSVKKVLQEVKAKETDFIVVGLGHYYIESTKSIQSSYIAEGAKVSEEDLDALLEKAENAYLKEDLEFLDVFLQYYHVDDVRGIQNPIGMRGVKLEAAYTIFACRKTLLANIEQCVNNAGYQVGDFVFSPYYASEILFTETDKEEGVLVIDCGADLTRVSIFVEGALYASFAVPFGGRSVSIDIKNSYPVTMKQAENLKKQFSCALAELAEENAEVGFKSSDAWGERSLRVSELAGVVQCRLDEIFRGIRYYLRKMALEDLVESIILTGGGAAQKGIKESIEKKFQVPVHIAKIEEDSFLTTDALPELKYANALGVLHFELKEETIENFDEKPKFFEKLSEGFRNLFGRKHGEEDTQM